MLPRLPTECDPGEGVRKDRSAPSKPEFGASIFFGRSAIRRSILTASDLLLRVEGKEAPVRGRAKPAAKAASSFDHRTANPPEAGCRKCIFEDNEWQRNPR